MDNVFGLGCHCHNNTRKCFAPPPLPSIAHVLQFAILVIFFFYFLLAFLSDFFHVEIHLEPTSSPFLSCTEGLKEKSKEKVPDEEEEVVILSPKGDEQVVHVDSTTKTLILHFQKE